MRRGVVMALAMLAVAGAAFVLTARPAAAEKPYDYCDEYQSDFTYENAVSPESGMMVRSFTILGNGYTYYTCAKEDDSFDKPDGYTCYELRKDQYATDDGGGFLGVDWGSFFDLTDWGMYDWVNICVEGDHDYVLCRNDIRFGFGDNFGGPSSRSLLPHDTYGIAFIPNDTPNWWKYEVWAESGYDQENDEWGDAENGQGCRLAAYPAAGRTCAELNEDKEVIRSDINDIEDDIEEMEEDYQWYVENNLEHEYNLDALNDKRGELRDKQEELGELEGIGSIIPDDCWGSYPNHHYQITWDSSDDGITDPSRLMGWLASILFGFSKLAISAMLWLIRLGFSFDVTEYRRTVGNFADRIDRELVHFGDHPLSLFDIAWFALFAYAGFQALRGRVGRAGGEIGMSILLAAVATALIGNFFPQDDDTSFRSSVSIVSPAYQEGGYFDSAGDMLNMSAIALLRVANGDDPNVEKEDINRQFIEDQLRESNGRLHLEFVERPYLFIQWGKESFGDSVQEPVALDEGYDRLSCDQVNAAILAMPDKADLGYWVQNFMERHGCTQEADFNGDMTVERLMATVVTTIVALIVSVLVGLAAITLLLSKFLVAVFFVALPLAVVGALLPGRSRQMAWGWMTSVLQLWLAALGMGLVVALLMMGLDAIHETTEDRDLMERWIMVLLLVATIYMLRKKIVSGSQNAAQALSNRLTSSTGATPHWAGAGNGMGGVDLMGADKGLSKGAMAGMGMAVVGGRMAWVAGRTVGRGARRTVGAPSRGLYRTVRQRRQENRQARKAQAWHWRNTRNSQDLNYARQVLLGDAPTRDQAHSIVGGRHSKEDKALRKQQKKERKGVRQQQQQENLNRQQKARNPVQAAMLNNRIAHADARQVDAALAGHDWGRVRKAVRGGQSLQGDTLDSARRLGLSESAIGQWNTNHDRNAGATLLRQGDHQAKAAAMRAGNLGTPSHHFRDPAFVQSQLSARDHQFRSDVAKGMQGGLSQQDAEAQAWKNQKYSARDVQRRRSDAQLQQASQDLRSGYQDMRGRHRQQNQDLADKHSKQRSNVDQRHQAEHDWVDKNFMSEDEARRFRESFNE